MLGDERVRVEALIDRLLEPVEEREELARVRHVGPHLVKDGRMPCGLVEPAHGGVGVTNGPLKDEVPGGEL